MICSAVGARRRDRLDRARIDALDRFREQLADQGEGSHRQRQHAGERPDAHPEHEDHHVQQGLDRAQDVERRPRGAVQPDQAGGCDPSGSWPPGS